MQFNSKKQNKTLPFKNKTEQKTVERNEQKEKTNFPTGWGRETQDRENKNKCITDGLKGVQLSLAPH